MHITNKTAEAVISQIKPIFARFGTPYIHVSDNVTYNSDKPLKFARSWNFIHVTLSPEYLQSNELHFCSKKQLLIILVLFYNFSQNQVI